MRKKVVVQTPPEIKNIDKKENAALEEFNKKAQEALSIIQENHFHLRLWKAVGGDS